MDTEEKISKRKMWSGDGKWDGTQRQIWILLYKKYVQLTPVSNAYIYRSNRLAGMLKRRLDYIRWDINCTKHIASLRLSKYGHCCLCLCCSGSSYVSYQMGLLATCY